MTTVTADIEEEFQQNNSVKCESDPEGQAAEKGFLSKVWSGVCGTVSSVADFVVSNPIITGVGVLGFDWLCLGGAMTTTALTTGANIFGGIVAAPFKAAASVMPDVLTNVWSAATTVTGAIPAAIGTTLSGGEVATEIVSDVIASSGIANTLSTVATVATTGAVTPVASNLDVIADVAETALSVTSPGVSSLATEAAAVGSAAGLSVAKGVFSSLMPF